MTVIKPDFKKKSKDDFKLTEYLCDVHDRIKRIERGLIVIKETERLLKIVEENNEKNNKNNRKDNIRKISI